MTDKELKQAVDLLAKYGRRIPNPKLMRRLDYAATAIFVSIYLAVVVMVVKWLVNG